MQINEESFGPLVHKRRRKGKERKREKKEKKRKYEIFEVRKLLTIINYLFPFPNKILEIQKKNWVITKESREGFGEGIQRSSSST